MKINEYFPLIISFIIGAIIPILVLVINNKHQENLFAKQKKYDLRKNRFDQFESLLQSYIHHIFSISLYIEVFFDWLENDNFSKLVIEDSFKWLIKKYMNYVNNNDNVGTKDFLPTIINNATFDFYFDGLNDELNQYGMYYEIMAELLILDDRKRDFSEEFMRSKLVNLKNKFDSLPELREIQKNLMMKLIDIEEKKCIDF